MFKKTVFILSASLMMCLSLVAQEKTPGVRAKLLLEGGLEYGGDELLQVFFTNGEDQVMRAGQGGFLSVGGQLDFPKIKQLMLRGGIGWKYNTTAADDANIRFTRLPMYLMPFYKINENFRFGAGITTHQSVRFKGDGFVPDADMTSNLGARFEFGYKWIALTYTSIKYTLPNSEVLSGSSIGVALSFTIPGS
ncbi:hypothetical protein [Algoriphagus taiwanensis]|uniref:Outer membrane protein beta-barrel domain-containing protein n=1 Tax=Algoriphagus taiwanensis TaxID=1445656 RepID=A0ABQ6Q2X7_9BACT|nr:hypothetical protein Ataiwa_28120 [Algoriphagus taiwanensis]